MSKHVSWGGVLIAAGAAVASYSKFGDPHNAAVLEAIGALLAAIGRSIVAPETSEKPPE